jgi:ribonuclease E
MSKIMLINVTHAEESRVGIVDDGQLESFEIESFSREHLKGNIYKGVVRRIHPAIEAAFVDIGADRDAFLPSTRSASAISPGGTRAAATARARKARRVKKPPPHQGRPQVRRRVPVQIIKEQFTNKPRRSPHSIRYRDVTWCSCRGRRTPGSRARSKARSGSASARSSKIRSRRRLRIIVRTAAGFDEDHGELDRDLAYLHRLWESIKQNAETRRGPALIYREHDLVLRNIRDYFTPDIDEVFIDNEDVYERAKDFLHNIMPGKEHLLHLYQGDQPIFSRFGLETQIESIYKRRVALKSGGSIVIDGTEALTAIDVNSGGSMRGTNQEETAHKTNLEAAREVARQLRLRDLGGIIVVDFIDMRVQSHINDVERALREAMRPEKARHDVGRISRLGLLEISRQRLRPAAVASSYAACPMCEGHGSIRTAESAALGTLRKIHHRIAEGDIAQMNVTLPRDVAMYLLNQKRDDLATLERRYSARSTSSSARLMPHQSEIETRTREITAPAMVRPGEVAPADRTGASASARGARRPSLGGVTQVRGSGTPAREGEDDAAQRRRRAAVVERRGEDSRLRVRVRGARGGRRRGCDRGAASRERARERARDHRTMTDVDAGADVGLEPTMEDACRAPGPSLRRSDGRDRRIRGNWIEAIAPFVPSDGSSSSDAASPSEQMRRRRRRGGRRGGRGRRPGPERRSTAKTVSFARYAGGRFGDGGGAPRLTRLVG